LGNIKKQNIMKKVITNLALATMLFMGMASMQAQELRSSSGSSTGKIDNDGTIRNSSGSSKGKIDSDGTIRNSSGSSIGKIDSDGTIRNSSGSSIGKLDSDGTVRNSSGSSIGSANRVKKSWAAVVFFFFQFN
jgi:5-fold beta-flower domain-containing protein